MKKLIEFEKIGTTENHADMLTKPLDKTTRDKHLGEMSLKLQAGRSQMTKDVLGMTSDERVGEKTVIILAALKMVRVGEEQRSNNYYNQSRVSNKKERSAPAFCKPNQHFVFF